MSIAKRHILYTGRTTGVVIALVTALVLLGPVGILVFDALLSLPEIPTITGRVFDMRSVTLLAKSVVLSGTVSLSSTILAIMLVRFAKGHWIVWLPLGLLLVPPYVHATAWMAFAAKSQAALAGMGIAAPAFSNIFGAVWIQLTAFFPISLGFAFAGFGMADHRQIEVARVFTNDWRVFRNVELPQILPAASIGAVLVFVLSITDFSTPSLMRIQVYALEAFVEYSISADSLSAFIVALPLLTICVGLMLLVVLPIRNLETAPLFRRPTIRSEGPMLRLAGLAASLFAILQFGVPILMLTTSAFPISDITAIISQNGSEIFNSLLTASIASGLSLILALAILPYLTSPTRLALVVIPFAVPASLTGIGLIKLWLLPGFDIAYNTAAMPILAATAQFASIAILILYVQSKRTEASLLDAAMVFRGPVPAVWFRILLPQWHPGILAAYLAVFVLTLAELTASLLVAPPGHQMLTAKIFSMLHFGASQQVAVLCLLILFASILSMGVIFLSLTSANKRRGRT